MAWYSFKKDFSDPEETQWYWEQKSTVAPDVVTREQGGHASQSPGSFVRWLQANDNWDLSFAMLIEYYKRCAPFANSVNEIADAIAEIPIKVWDKRTSEYVEHPVLELLEYPNSDMSREDFMRHLSSMYNIVGNPFLDILGQVNREPLTIDVINPQYAHPLADRFGELGIVNVTTNFWSRTYTSEPVRGRRRLRDGNDKELWQVFSFNPDRGSN